MSTMTTGPMPAAAPKNSTPAVPPLHNGDRLTREEFHRRYEAMPHVDKAELIEGVVYMPSPVRHDDYCYPNSDMVTWLGFYRAYTPGLQGGTNGTLKLDLANEPQPDAYVIVLPACGGQVEIDDGGYIVGGPEFVGETSASTVSYDLHGKLHAYRRNQVKEYVVWRVEDQAIDWFVLRGENYERLAPGEDGFLKSAVFPGLWLDPPALMRGDLRRVFEVVQLGLATAEYAEFVRKLESRRQPRS